MLLAGLRARRARTRRLWPECQGQVLAALRAIAAARQLDRPVSCEPITYARGGFFSALVEAPAGSRFVKAVPTRSREALFWEAWRRGLIRCEGVHYRLVPPAEIASGRMVTVLSFPRLQVVRPRKSARSRLFGRDALEVVRALADFNSDHRLAEGAFPPARDCGPVPVPRPRRVARALGVEVERSRAIAADLRAVEAGWHRVRGPVDAGDRCLAHMDLGMGNILLDHRPMVMLDFGHAGIAPVGADLHTVLLYADPDPAAATEMAEVYAAVFREKGQDVDPAAVLRSAQAHFAARYRDLRFFSARRPATFDAALALSRELVDAAR